MKLGKSNWFIAIVLACGLVATGCAPLSRNHKTATAVHEETPSADTSWGPAEPKPPPKTKGLSYFIDRIFHNDSAFFNDKSHEIEASLY